MVVTDTLWGGRGEGRHGEERGGVERRGEGGEEGRGGEGRESWGVESKDTHIIGRVVHALTHTSLCPLSEPSVACQRYIRTWYLEWYYTV